MRYAKIDSTGIFISDVFAEAPAPDLIATPCPGGFYLPKWDGKQWIEGRTLDEIIAIKASAAQTEPSVEERVKCVENDVDEIISVLAVMEGVV